MAKHTQTIRQILLSVFDHSVGLAPKGLTTVFLIDIQVSQTFKNRFIYGRFFDRVFDSFDFAPPKEQIL